MRKITFEDRKNILNRNIDAIPDLQVDAWDEENFRAVTGMPIDVALVQGQTGAWAFKKYQEWMDTNPHQSII